MRSYAGGYTCTRIARRRSVTHVYKETRAHIHARGRTSRCRWCWSINTLRWWKRDERRKLKGSGRTEKREEALLKPWTLWTDICTMRSPKSRVAVLRISSLIHHLALQIVTEISGADVPSGARFLYKEESDPLYIYFHEYF